jgi:hypothetical protein
VAHQERRLEILQAGVAGKRETFRDGEAEPVHAGIDVDGGG